MKYNLRMILTIISFSFLIVSANAAEVVDINGRLIYNNNIGVAKATITITTTGGASMQTTTSDSSGAFSFTNIKRGLYNFRIEAKGFYTVRFERHAINPDTTQFVRVMLVPVNEFENLNCEKGTISGNILFDELDEPIPGTEIYISNLLYEHKKSISRWDGKFNIENIPTGKYNITAKAIAFSIITIEDVVLDSSKCYSIDFRMIHGNFKSPNLPIIR